MIFVSRTVPGKTCATVVINTESRLHLRERLFGDKLEKALTTIFEEYSTDVVIKKLAPASNSQRNEALNSVVSTKAPKSRYYGGSESNNFRVACGVGQTNEGSKYMYVPQVIKEIGLKAGEHWAKHCQDVDRKRQQDKARKSSLQFKEKRASRTCQKISRTARKESEEGPTYSTGVGLNLDPWFQFWDFGHNWECHYIKTSRVWKVGPPPFVKRPNQPQVSFDVSSSNNFIFFDIETTTTGNLAEISQLSAVTASKDGKELNFYVLPERAINQKASRVNKLSVHSTANSDQVLLNDGAPVDSITIAQCLRNSSSLLHQQISKPRQFELDTIQLFSTRQHFFAAEDNNLQINFLSWTSCLPTACISHALWSKPNIRP